MPKTNSTKCTDEVIATAREYLDGGYESAGHVVPTHSGLALYLGVARQTPKNWAAQEENNKNAQAMAAILDELTSRQEVLIIAGGLSKQYDSGFAKMMAANHGYSDKHTVDNTSSDGSMKPTQIVLTAPDDDSEA